MDEKTLGELQKGNARVAYLLGSKETMFQGFNEGQKIQCLEDIVAALAAQLQLSNTAMMEMGFPVQDQYVSTLGNQFK